MNKITLNWGQWIYGLVAGFIGGGASSATSGLAAIGIDPSHFNLGSTTGGLSHVLTLVGATFVVSGVLHALAFLSQMPLPPVAKLNGNGKAGN